MKNHLFFLLLSITIFSCSKQTPLTEKFKCKSVKINNLESVYDFNKNFKIRIPTSWKTNLYYDKYESSVFAADTLRELTDSYILGTSFTYGKLDFNEAYIKKIDSVLTVNSLEKIDEGNELFKTKKTYWYLVKGKKNGFPYQQFNLTVKLSENTYFNAYSEVYGEDNIHRRTCESISIIEKIEFLQ